MERILMKIIALIIFIICFVSGFFYGSCKADKIKNSSITCYDGGKIIFADSINGNIERYNTSTFWTYDKDKTTIKISGTCIITEDK
jgi:hypothetical protein